MNHMDMLSSVVQHMRVADCPDDIWMLWFLWSHEVGLLRVDRRRREALRGLIVGATLYAADQCAALQRWMDACRPVRPPSRAATAIDVAVQPVRLGLTVYHSPQTSLNLPVPANTEQVRDIRFTLNRGVTRFM